MKISSDTMKTMANIKFDGNKNSQRKAIKSNREDSSKLISRLRSFNFISSKRQALKFIVGFVFVVVILSLYMFFGVAQNGGSNQPGHTTEDGAQLPQEI